MPATLVAEHLAPLTSLVTVEELSNSERAVALYASDMPTRYRFRRGDMGRVIAWTVQGAMRLGREELHRSAAYAYGYRLLSGANWLTPEQEEAHARRFPSAARLDRAESLGALLTSIPDVRMSPQARERGRSPLVEGACRCAGRGWVAYDMGDGTDAVQACPGHNPDERLPLRSEVAA